MKKVLAWLGAHFEEALLSVLLVCIACVEFLQVVFRNLSFVDALTWAEEFCRFCWVATVFFSLPYTIANGSMLRVGVLQDILPPRAKKALTYICDGATLAACVLLSCGAVRALWRVFESGELSSAMLLPMWTLYALLCVGLLLGAVRAAQRLFGIKGGGA